MELSDKVICDLLKNKPKEGLKALYDKYYGLRLAVFLKVTRET